jgi:C4-dicarboxylate transporter DctQ subunit
LSGAARRTAVRTISRLFDFIEKTINSIIIVLLMLMTAAIFYQVVLRYVFHSANIWAEEFARYSFIWVVMLGSSSALRRFRHIRIDFLVQALSQRTQKAVSFCNYLLMLLFLGVLVVYGVRIAEQAADKLSAGLGVSMGFMYLSIPIGSALMFLFTLEILAREYLSRGEKPAGRGGAS